MKTLVLAILSALLLLTSCARPKSSGPEPVEILYVQDTCQSCGMLISEPRFACELLLKDGQALKFDDISEMVVYNMDHPDQEVNAWFVHDNDSEEWIRGETAFYLISDQLLSPMGHGIIGFPSRAAAEKAQADLGGEVYNFDEMRAQVHMSAHQ